MGAQYSFAVLVPPQRSDLVSYAVRLCRSRHSAEDLVQDAFVKALRAWDSFEPPEGIAPDKAVRAWLYKIVYNEFVHVWRRNGRQGEAKTRYMHEVPQDTDPRREPTEGFSDEVSTAIAALDPDYRKVLLLFAEGKAYREIAEALDIPIGTVMSRLFRARRAVEKQLGDYAAAEYRLRRKCTRVYVARSEPAQDVEPDADCIDGVVGDLDDGSLVDSEPLADAQPTG